MGKLSEEEIADKIAAEVITNKKNKVIKVRTLLKHFYYVKRTTENSTRITKLLADRNILLSPSIMKLDESWQLKLDDRVSISVNKGENIVDEKNIVESSAELFRSATDASFDYKDMDTKDLPTKLFKSSAVWYDSTNIHEIDFDFSYFDDEFDEDDIEDEDFDEDFDDDDDCYDDYFE